MAYRWSLAANDEVWADEYDDEVCCECGDGVEYPVCSDDDEAFCKPCYNDIFGEEN